MCLDQVGKKKPKETKHQGLAIKEKPRKDKTPMAFCSVAVCERRPSAHAGSILPSGFLVRMVRKPLRFSEAVGRSRRFHLLNPLDVQAPRYECKHIGNFFYHFGGGFPGPVASLGVHVDQQGVALLPAAAHNVLKRGDELQGV